MTNAQAWRDAFEAKVVNAQRRKPSSDFLEGLAYAQARAIRVMHNHWKRRQMTTTTTTTTNDDDVDSADEKTDAEVKNALEAYQEAVAMDDGVITVSSDVPTTDKDSSTSLSTALAAAMDDASDVSAGGGSAQ